jgi:hypothetical protein
MTRQQYILDRSIPEPNSGCWLWQLSLSEDGYARGAGPNLKPENASRISYRAFVGATPPGLHVDHVCKTRGCVNPDHLRLVTPLENYATRDLSNNAQSRKTHCKNGHPFNAARRCMICERAWKTRYRNAHRDALNEKKRLKRMAGTAFGGAGRRA